MSETPIWGWSIYNILMWIFIIVASLICLCIDEWSIFFKYPWSKGSKRDFWLFKLTYKGKVHKI